MAKDSVKKEELRIIEALLFAAPEVLTQSKVDLCFGDDAPRLDKIVNEIQRDYDREERSFTVEKVGGGYRLVTRSEYEPWVRRLHARSTRMVLSRAALEALAVVAYKGPASRAEIESIRGVNSASVLRTLLEKKLVRIRGRGDSPGRPLLYKVTENFLITFGLNSLSELPKLREISELISGESHGEDHTSQEFSSSPDLPSTNATE